MSKKNIARSAIEGGRRGICRFFEEEADKRERNYYKKYCREAARDPEIDEPKDNSFAGPWDIGRQVREFDDKLNPVKRWLESQVGRPWEKIEKEIRERFDPRTLAGRHVLDHIDGFVNDKPGDNPFDFWSIWRKKGTEIRRPGELYVDKHGILRMEPKISKEAYYKRLREARDKK